MDDLVDLLLEEAVLYDEMQRIELEFLQIEMSLPEDRCVRAGAGMGARASSMGRSQTTTCKDKVQTLE